MAIDHLAEVRAALDEVDKSASGPWRTAVAVASLRNAAVAIAALVDQVGTLGTDNDVLRADQRKDAATIADLRAKLAEAHAEVARLRLQVCRLTSGQAIESDHLCPHDDRAVAALADRDAALAKLAEAKRLGLEACARGEGDAECGREYGCDPDGYAAIRTALEAL